MNKNCTIIANSKAGALKITPGADTISLVAKEIGLDAEVKYSGSPGEMKRLVNELVHAGVKKIVVAGGDGTVRLAVQEMVGSNSILGIIPLGTANNFATALYLPMDLRSALSTVKDGVVKEVSVGKIGNHYFTEAAGVGLFADGLALYGAGSNKNLFRALYAFIRLMFSFPRFRIKVTIDGKEIVDRAAMCTVANTFRLGSGWAIAPDAHLTDDVLDISVLGNLRRREIPLYYKAIRSQLQASLPKVRLEKGKVITIESLHTLNVHCDDRVIGTTPVTITVVPKAIKVMTGRL
jgi:diacylglycerol kinase (ATP)